MVTPLGKLSAPQTNPASQPSYSSHSRSKLKNENKNHYSIYKIGKKKKKFGKKQRSAVIKYEGEEEEEDEYGDEDQLINSAADNFAFFLSLRVWECLIQRC